MWQARRESNPQPPVLETGALPVELLACILTPEVFLLNAAYFVSRCAVCDLQNGQNFLSSSRSVVFFLFFVVL